MSGSMRFRALLFVLPFALASRAAGALEALQVAPGVYAVAGASGTPEPHNRGDVANAGFIVGATGVVVIDTGTSMRFGRDLLRAIRAVTDRPVALVILTHADQEFVFGAGAFADAGAEISAHRETIALMSARCGHCLDRLRPILGHDLDETRLVLPTRAFETSLRLPAGGTLIDVLHFGWASTPGDVVVFHPPSGVAFAGGMVVSGHIPRIRDCDFRGWQSALARLRALPIRRIVPGFGPVGGTEAIDATAGYLRALDDRVQALYRAGVSLLDAPAQSDLAEYRGWAAYEAHHRQNALHRYLQLEIEDLGGDPRSTALPGR
jgi:glyoxylase-like metal-dependent hydrolase (beta-lactamase superfamily II)